MEKAPETVAVSEIGAEQLAARIEAGEPLQLLDVRAPERLASGSVDVTPAQQFLNVRGSELLASDAPEQLGVRRDMPVVAVCGHGNSSAKVAAQLAPLGFDVHSLAGGLRAWMDVLVPRELDPPAGFDRLVQFDRVGKGALGYLLVAGDAALVIDPPRKFAAYEQAAAQTGARIVAVADTHIHADYISGCPELAARYGVPYYMHPADHVYPYDGTPGRLEIAPLSDGQRLRIGGSEVGVEHTPGHTEGSVTFIAGDCAFSGDFLFIESVGRPDLADRKAEWTEMLFDSLQQLKRTCPAHFRMLPAHYAGDSERNADRSVWASFVEVLRRNESLRNADRAQFRAWVDSHTPTPPAAYRRIKGINVGIFRVDDDEAAELEAGKNECAL